MTVNFLTQNNSPCTHNAPLSGCPVTTIVLLQDDGCPSHGEELPAMDPALDPALDENHVASQNLVSLVFKELVISILGDGVRMHVGGGVV